MPVRLSGGERQRVAFTGGSRWLRDSGLPVGHAVRLRVPARESVALLQRGASVSCRPGAMRVPLPRAVV
jgi:hypothetical protein